MRKQQGNIWIEIVVALFLTSYATIIVIQELVISNHRLSKLDVDFKNEFTPK